MSDGATQQNLEAIVRGISSAGKALKLYPPSSPIPHQAVETAHEALSAYLLTEPVLSLSVARDGFTVRGNSVGVGMPGVADLADQLRDQGLAEVDFMPGCAVEEMISFLSAIMRDPHEVRSEGGIGVLLAAAGVDNVRTTDVHLTVIEEAGPDPDQDVEEFLRQLANDPDRLATWMAAASAGDPAAFADGLSELASVVGDGGLSELMRSLASAFTQQSSDGKDVLLGLSMEPGVVRTLSEGMFRNLQSASIADALCGGLYGKNMLSLSNALTALPLQESLRQVYADVQSALAGEHSTKELSFLEHMLDVRARVEPETPLVRSDATYEQVARVADISPEDLAQLRDHTLAQRENGDLAGVNTMLVLLDQQTDFALYCETLDNLASMVPRFLEWGELDLADRVLTELTSREARPTQPWPDLAERLRAAIAVAVSPRAMVALLRATIADHSLVRVARDIVHQAPEAAQVLVTEAIGFKEEGLRIAEELLGRRVLDMLVATAGQAQWFQLAPIVARLGNEGDARSLQVIESLAARTDEQSRREVAHGLARATSPATLRILGALSRDDSAEVAVIAVRALAQHKGPAPAATLAQLLGELDIDGKDFPVAREVIGALARNTDPAARTTLEHLVNRKALIKRGHFAEIHELAVQAVRLHSQQGGAR